MIARKTPRKITKRDAIERTPMSNQGRSQSQQRKIKADAESLLHPVIGFLMASGMSPENIAKTVGDSVSRVKEQGGKTSVNSMKQIDTYRDIVSRWTTRAEFVDKEGAPRELSVGGKFGFKSLVLSVSPATDVEKAIQDLQRYGNIRRQKSGKLKLLKKFLHVTSSKTLAYEPHFSFLSQACDTTGSLLRKKQPEKALRNFWRTAEVVDLPATDLPEFLRFAKERSLTFLQELDEWLRAHSQAKKKGISSVRAGLGLFSFHDVDA